MPAFACQVDQFTDVMNSVLWWIGVVSVDGESGDPARLDDRAVLYSAADVVMYGVRPCRFALEVLQRREQFAQFSAGNKAGLQHMSQECVPLFDSSSGPVRMIRGRGG